MYFRESNRDLNHWHYYYYCYYYYYYYCCYYYYYYSSNADSSSSSEASEWKTGSIIEVRLGALCNHRKTRIFFFSRPDTSSYLVRKRYLSINNCWNIFLIWNPYIAETLRAQVSARASARPFLWTPRQRGFDQPPYTLYTQVRVFKTGISQYGWLIIEQSNSNGYESKPLCS